MITGRALEKLGFVNLIDFELQNDSDGKGTYISEWHSSKAQPSQKEIDDAEKEAEKEFSDQAYARARKPLYPEIGDQLDDLYHKGAFSADMAAKIKKVKDDNPKG